MFKRRLLPFVFIFVLFILFISLFIQNLYASKTYNIAKFNNKDKYPVKINDNLTGVNPALGKTTIFFSRINIKEQLNLDNKGYWTYKIPEKIKNAEYRMTILNLNKKGDITSIKTYKIQIYSNPIDKILNRYTQKSKAQENPTDDKNYEIWASMMKYYGIYPVNENGEIVLYSREEYDKKYPYRIEAPEPYESIINHMMSDQSFLSNVIYKLYQKLYENGYAPLQSLTPYFPELEDLIKEGSINIPKSLYSVYPITKSEIDEATLEQYIRDSVNKVRGSKYILSQPDELANYLIDYTDPIFGIRSIINVFTLKSTQITDEDKINALLALAIIAVPTEKVLSAGSKLVDMSIDFVKAIKDIKSIKTALKAGETIPLRVAEDRVTSWTFEQRTWNSLYDGSVNATKHKRLYPLTRAMTEDELQFTQTWIMPLIKSSKAFVLDRSYYRQTLVNFLNQMKPVLNKIGGFNYQDIYKTLDNDWVIIVKKEDIVDYLNGPGVGFAHGRIIVINAEYFMTVYDSDFWYKTIYHELIHVISSSYERTNKVRMFYVYGQNQEDDYGRLMSLFYEFGTDELVRVYTGLDSTYSILYPNQYQSMYTLIDRLVQKSGGKFQWLDMMEFSLTKDDGKLIRKIIGDTSDKLSISEFLSIVNVEIHPAWLTRILKDPMWFKQQSRFQSWIRKLGSIGGTTFLLSDIFIKSAKGEELPDNAEIVYMPLEFSEDISFIKDENTTEETPTEIELQPTEGVQINCKSPYPQCGGTVGLENYENNHIYMIKPICDSNGEITGYEEPEDQGVSSDCDK